MNETMKARREALGHLRDHFESELTIALARWKCNERFAKGRQMIRIGMLTIREHDPSIHTHYTSICVQGKQNALRVAQLDWLFRTGKMNVRIVAGMHIVEKFLPAEIMQQLNPTKFTREGFCTKFIGDDGNGLEASRISLAADAIACLLSKQLMYEVK